MEKNNSRQITFYAFSHPESGKSRNEDSYVVGSVNQFFAVSDGVGSTSGADQASRIVMETTELAFESKPSLGQETSFMRSLSKNIVAALNNDQSSKKMSATLTLLYLTEDKYYFAQIGDSRGYLFRGGVLQQITHDHSMAFEQYLAGAISKEELADHPNQKLLTRCLRKGSKFAIIDVFEGELRSGDTFLLCSDGLTKKYTDDEIATFLAREEGYLAMEQDLESQEREDDVTCIAVFFKE